MNKTTGATAAITAVALFVCYAHTLQGMFKQWMSDEDMAHGLAVPFVIGWLIFHQRGEWARKTYQPSAWGLGILLLGTFLHVAGVVGAGLFVSSVAFLVSVAGAIVCFGGFGLLRAWGFPMCLAVFMLPKLAIVYNQVTLPLQLLASKMAAALLTMSGTGVIRDGSILEVGNYRVEVAEACSGIRYILPLAFVALVGAYLLDAKRWMRPALLACAVPVAIGANALRVAAVALHPALGDGMPHTLAGIVIFGLCLAALALARETINRAYGIFRH